MPGLFDSLTIKNLTLKNRIVLPPMGTNVASEEGELTDKHLQRYLPVAEAGVGLIIVEHSYVSREGRYRATQLGVWHDKLIPGLRRLVDAVHAHGVPICLQLNHSGAKGFPEVIGRQPAGPSDVVPPGSTAKPRPMTREEIAEVVRAFGEAARRALEAGFDAVEVHGAHGYLLSQFVSPVLNTRNDEYGGDLEGRLRLPLEVLVEVRKRVGADYPVFYRLGADDLVPGGVTPEEGERIAARLAAAGVDVLDISGGIGGGGADLFSEQGFFVPLAARVKRASNAIVIGVGNVREPAYADRVVREGQIDLVAVGRAQAADPAWSRKAREALGRR
jgi:NADPH2 dehydrogenase